MAVDLDILQTKEFWEFYQFGTEERLKDKFLQQYVDWTFDEKWNENKYEPLELSFKILNDYQLNLKIEFDWWSINVAFKGKKRKKYTIGWWDHARWHPFAIQWDELITLFNYWADRPSKLPVDADIAFLLLAKFVGVNYKERKIIDEYNVDIKDAYESLGVLSKAAVKKLTKNTIFLPDKDYAWSDHEKFGPVFSGWYPCYSIRNEAHSGGEDGLFPFKEFQEMIARI